MTKPTSQSPGATTRKHDVWTRERTAVGNWTKLVTSSESGHRHSYAAGILALATEKVLIGLGERASCLRPREPLLFLKGNISLHSVNSTSLLVY